MTLGMGVFPFMSGLWADYNSSPAPLTDCNGTALALNQAVKLVGTIVALDPGATHFNAVTVKLSHPDGVGALVGARIVIDPKQLVVGS
jgi:hypothetical protein